jgi:hypothetical protein
LSFDEGLRRRSLTPIGDELRHRELEVGKPSLRERWRRRRRLLPRPTTWYGIVLVGIVRFVVVLAVAVGLVMLIGELVGWTSRHDLVKLFLIVGGGMVATLSTAAFGGGWGRWEGLYERSLSSRDRSQQLVMAIVGLCLIGIALFLDATK